jgi:hypothetical protein
VQNDPVNLARGQTGLEMGLKISTLCYLTFLGILIDPNRAVEKRKRRQRPGRPLGDREPLAGGWASVVHG